MPSGKTLINFFVVSFFELLRWRQHSILSAFFWKKFGQIVLVNVIIFAKRKMIGFPEIIYCSSLSQNSLNPASWLLLASGTVSHNFGQKIRFCPQNRHNYFKSESRKEIFVALERPKTEMVEKHSHNLFMCWTQESIWLVQIVQHLDRFVK